IAVEPVLSWKSRVVYFKVVTPGHPVSYGSTWQSDHPVRVVTVPVGYGDGYFRALSNTAQVIIRGTRYPVVGPSAMDKTRATSEGTPPTTARRSCCWAETGTRASRARTSPGGRGRSPTRSSPTSTRASPASTSREVDPHRLDLGVAVEADRPHLAPEARLLE